MKPKLILTCDDFAMHKLINLGALEAYKNNVLSGVSFVANGDAFDDGFLNDPALSSLIIEGRGPEYVEMYKKINLANRNHWLNDHGFDMFGIPREVRMGVSVSF